MFIEAVYRSLQNKKLSTVELRKNSRRYRSQHGVMVFAEFLRDSDDFQMLREPGKDVPGALVLGYTVL
jgi:hypothetical protein